MIDAIRKHLEMTPFMPFRVRTSDGHEYPVPTIDHIYLPPGSAWVIVSDDDGIVAVLPTRQVSGLLHAPNAPEPTPSV